LDRGTPVIKSLAGATAADADANATRQSIHGNVRSDIIRPVIAVIAVDLEIIIGHTAACDAVSTDNIVIKLAATLRWFTAGGAIRIAVRQLLQNRK